MMNHKKINWKHFHMALYPNIVVFAMVGFASYMSLIYAFPQIISKSDHIVLSYFLYFLSLFFLFMFLWCWIHTVTTDPGRITDFLQQKGLLDEIKRGDVPFCLHKLPICHECNVPMPPNSYHCEFCNSCHLRYDHHCGVVGQCIADKNTKSFILSLFYAFIFGIISALICFYYSFKLNSHNIFTFDRSETVVFIAGTYSAIFSVFIGNFAITMLVHQILSLKSMNKDINFTNFSKIFGDKWYKMLNPIQKDATNYAWPGIFWLDDFEL